MCLGKILLAFSLLHFVLQGQICLLLQVPLDFLLLHSNPLWWKGHIFGVNYRGFGEGNGIPLQYSCLENPRDRGTSWAAIYGVTQSRTRLKWLRSSIEGFVDLHRIGQLQLLWHQWLGHRLGLLWCWMVSLGNELRSFCHFWDCTQILHFGLFCWLWGLLHFF